MPRDRQIIGNCPKCDSSELVCSFNHFEQDDLTIDSWEHRCSNCGYRETTAYRSDEENETAADPRICPYCTRERQYPD